MEDSVKVDQAKRPIAKHDPTGTKPLKAIHPVKEIFEIGDTIGSGGFAKVRKATHKVIGEPVAIKIISKAMLKGEKEKHRLINEVEAMRMLRHPNICKLYDVIETENSVYMIMEVSEEHFLIIITIVMKTMY